jgi:hypothetical protein
MDGGRHAFMTALEREETAEALEGLSWSAWWLDDHRMNTTGGVDDRSRDDRPRRRA